MPILGTLAEQLQTAIRHPDGAKGWGVDVARGSAVDSGMHGGNIRRFRAKNQQMDNDGFLQLTAQQSMMLMSLLMPIAKRPHWLMQ